MKTKLGISAGLLGAAIYLSGLVSGYVVLVLLAGYVLLREENEWLKRAAVKACAICFGFSVLRVLIGFIPEAMNLVDEVARLFDETFYVNVLTRLVNLVLIVLSAAEDIVLLLLAFKAMKQNTVRISVVDKLVDQEFGPSAAPAARPVMNDTRFCTNCGKQIPASAAFCPHCGK